MKQEGTYDILLTMGDPQSETGFAGLSESEVAEMDEIRQLAEVVAEVLEAPQTSFTTT